MLLITHQSHLDALPVSPLIAHIQKRFDQLSEDSDVPPAILLLKPGDSPNATDLRVCGHNGLVSDIWEKHEPGHSEFCRVFEWASYLPSLRLYEVPQLVNNEDGYLILIPEAVVEAHPDLKWVLTDEHQGGLSDPQSL
jgi:hypothetical protein